MLLDRNKKLTVNGNLSVSNTLQLSSGNIEENNLLTLSARGINLNSSASTTDSFKIESSGGIKMISNDVINIQGKSGREVVFNNSGFDIDFRIGAINQPNVFYVKGLTSKVGIVNNSPNSDLDIGNKNSNDRSLNLNSSGSQYFRLETNGTTNKSTLMAGDDSTNNNIISFVTTKSEFKLRAWF